MNIPKAPSLFITIVCIAIMSALILAGINFAISIAVLVFCMVLFAILDEIRQNTKPNPN